MFGGNGLGVGYLGVVGVGGCVVLVVRVGLVCVVYNSLLWMSPWPTILLPVVYLFGICGVLYGDVFRFWRMVLLFCPFVITLGLSVGVGTAPAIVAGAVCGLSTVCVTACAYDFVGVVSLLLPKGSLLLLVMVLCGGDGVLSIMISSTGGDDERMGDVPCFGDSVCGGVCGVCVFCVLVLSVGVGGVCVWLLFVCSVLGVDVCC